MIDITLVDPSGKKTYYDQLVTVLAPLDISEDDGEAAEVESE